jgi:hypothetical protein
MQQHCLQQHCLQQRSNIASSNSSFKLFLSPSLTMSCYIPFTSSVFIKDVLVDDKNFYINAEVLCTHHGKNFYHLLQSKTWADEVEKLQKAFEEKHHDLFYNKLNIRRTCVPVVKWLYFLNEGPAEYQGAYINCKLIFVVLNFCDVKVDNMSEEQREEVIRRWKIVREMNVIIKKISFCEANAKPGPIDVTMPLIDREGKFQILAEEKSKWEITKREETLYDLVIK